MYSGHVAGAVFARLEIPEHCIILCPNHTGRGSPLAIMSATRWQTPLGEVAPDPELATQLLRLFPALEEDSAAHRSEHAIEVQLPFLQARLVPAILECCADWERRSRKWSARSQRSANVSKKASGKS
jgi:hypothetical protein